MKAKPFVKWAGGKGGLISQISQFYPYELDNNKIETYIEPFLGGGAILIDILQNYDIEKAYAFDINKDLINCYQVIQTNVDELIDALKLKEKEYLEIEFDDRQNYYYKVRDEYNSYNLNSKSVKRAAEFIFLNRTCFNGLYRVNKEGKFNVPSGKYKNPKICDEENLKELAKVIKNVQFICGNYNESKKFITENTFIYFDPPYRPLREQGFTSYTKEQFNDDDQKKLSLFYQEVTNLGAKAMLSNSDPKNTNINDNFFDNIYKNFNINRIYAKRMINSNANGRGDISELLITNYDSVGMDECIAENSFMKIVVSN